MVKYNKERIEKRDKEFLEYCQRNKKPSTLGVRIGWELLTRGIIPEGIDEPLSIGKKTLERIFSDLNITPMNQTSSRLNELQTYRDIFNYAVNRREHNKELTQEEYQERINQFFKSYF